MEKKHKRSELHKHTDDASMQSSSEEMCLTWKADELYDVLVDFIYFHMVIVFNADAETTYRRHNPSHPYFSSYMRLKEFNSSLLKHMATAFQFPDTLRATMEEHSELVHIGFSSTKHRPTCQICGGNHFSRMLIFRGRRYRLKERVYLKPGKNIANEEQFPACKFHYLAIKNYYYLRHMEWLVYWNCSHRIQAALERSPHSTSEELINAVDPKTIDSLASFFMAFYRQLDRWSYSNPGVNHAVPQHTFSDWPRLIRAWKKIAVARSKEGEVVGDDNVLSIASSESEGDDGDDEE